MNLVKAMFGGLMLAAAPLAALAEGMSYSYVDAAYVDTDIDGAPSADGFGLRGSFGFAGGGIRRSRTLERGDCSKQAARA